MESSSGWYISFLPNSAVNTFSHEGFIEHCRTLCLVAVSTGGVGRPGEVREGGRGGVGREAGRVGGSEGGRAFPWQTASSYHLTLPAKIVWFNVTGGGGLRGAGGR